MRIETIGLCAVGVLMVAGCDRLERIVGLGHQAQEETIKRELERPTPVEDRQHSLQGERDSLTALIAGKLVVLSNRVAEAEAAIRTLQADRSAFSKELSATMGKERETNGVGLERALSSPVVNELAMKYLHMDFSVARGEYVEAIAKARANEAEYKKAVQKLDQDYEGLLDPNPQVNPAARRARTLAYLEREHDQLERKRVRLARTKIPTGNVYRNQQAQHDRELRNIELRLREIERMIDQLKTGDERERRNADQIAETTRQRALRERTQALETLKRETAGKAHVLQTVQLYNEKTLRRMEQALVKEAATLEEKRHKSLEGCLTLKGIQASVPKLSTVGLKKLQEQVMAL